MIPNFARNASSTVRFTLLSSSRGTAAGPTASSRLASSRPSRSTLSCRHSLCTPSPALPALVIPAGGHDRLDLNGLSVDLITEDSQPHLGAGNVLDSGFDPVDLNRCGMYNKYLITKEFYMPKNHVQFQKG